MDATPITLDDRYKVERGRVFLTGVQALTRLPIIQAQRDKAAGLNTGGFISGYRGSPLGGYDGALWQAQAYLDENRIKFQPAINEELAATAIIGTQQINSYPDAAVDGVFSIWYGKGPGSDRASDAMKHAHSIGTTPHGGVLVVVGDDPGAVSSAVAHQCEQLLSSWLMPILYPASVHEYIEYGLLGFAISRYAGCYIGFKAVSETVESAASVSVDPDQPDIVIPEDHELPPDGVHVRWPDPQLVQEARLHDVKLPAVQAFAKANKIDRTVMGGEKAKIGIVSAGKAYLDLMQALAELGIDEARAEELGLSVYKVGLVWPMEPDGLIKFADGLEQILVVEEKRAFMETQIKEIFYNRPVSDRPVVIGKQDETGAPLLPTHGETNPEMIARVLMARLSTADRDDKMQMRLHYLDQVQAKSVNPPIAMRPPFFCSGCPHNRSTVVPEGSRAFAGTGCHLMAGFMNRKTDLFIQMGGEGVPWMGQAPFCTSDHIFQNLGDGTYVHSGSLAIRQSIAAGVNITYKILYNDAVAMTGGQPFEGGVTVPQITQQVYHEGVRRIAVLTDGPDKYPSNVGFAPGVTVHHRDKLDSIQQEFRRIKGVTVIVYDQVCATEKRRRRRRGKFPEADTRIYINAAVCEGCGDCSVQSNCISVSPLETPLGRKRVVDQSSCNQDFSCLNGFCPSFVSLKGATLKKKSLVRTDSTDPIKDLPVPNRQRIDRSYGIVVAGVGGTGVVTIGQIIGMAAHIDGLGCSLLDFTGLAQKGGGVLTHIQISEEPDENLVVRLPVGGADLLIAGDMVVGSGAEALAKLSPNSLAVVNSKVQATAESVMAPDSVINEAALRDAIAAAVDDGEANFFNATNIAEALTGDSVTANIFLVGYAFQKGAIPVSLNALLQAIKLNGVAVQANTHCFNWGRQAAADPETLEKVVGELDGEAKPFEETLEEQIERRSRYLTDYQNAAYAQRYRQLLDTVSEKEMSVTPDSNRLASAVARDYFRLMAIKDEYEVARLFTNGNFEKDIKERFEGEITINFHMAPPVFRWFGKGGAAKKLRPDKKIYGPWIRSVMKMLSRLRTFRGTAIVLFGLTDERMMERRLIEDYENTIKQLLAGLDENTYDQAIDIATIYETVRGYGPVKEKSIVEAREKHDKLMNAFIAGLPPEESRQSPIAAE